MTEQDLELVETDYIFTLLYTLHRIVRLIVGVTPHFIYFNREYSQHTFLIYFSSTNMLDINEDTVALVSYPKRITKNTMQSSLI